MSEKNFYIFAGVNGAGKSSLYKLSTDDYGERINTDEIVSKIGSWENTADQIKASRKAIEMRNNFIQKGISFNQETTLTGNTILKAIEKAKKNGYKIFMFYVGVENPEIAKNRVKRRVDKGGHDIPAETIEKRYYESLKNLEKIALSCDILVIHDNSKFETVHTRCLIIEDSSILLLVKELPKWVNDLKNNLENQLLQKKTLEESPKDSFAKKLANDKKQGLNLEK